MSDQANRPKLATIPAWRCKECQAECIPVRSESRCLCGHRLKQHAQEQADEHSAFRCKSLGCNCTSFFYTVGEGSWILRCRCKHRHTDHDPATHVCRKPGCECDHFHSPWVCNCDHSWELHEMVLKEKQLHCLSTLTTDVVSCQAGGNAMLAADDMTSEVNRWDMLKRGTQEGG